MRRIIKDITYHHEGDRSQVNIDVEVQGASSTHMLVQSVTYLDTTTVEFWTETGSNGIEALADNEGISTVEALGAIAGLLADLESADRLNRRARSGLSAHVLRQMTEDRT